MAKPKGYPTRRAGERDEYFAARVAAFKAGQEAASTAADSLPDLGGASVEPSKPVEVVESPSDTPYVPETVAMAGSPSVEGAGEKSESLALTETYYTLPVTNGKPDDVPEAPEPVEETEIPPVEPALPSSNPVGIGFPGEMPGSGFSKPPATFESFAKAAEAGTLYETLSDTEKDRVYGPEVTHGDITLRGDKAKSPIAWAEAGHPDPIAAAYAGYKQLNYGVKPLGYPQIAMEQLAAAGFAHLIPASTDA